MKKSFNIDLGGVVFRFDEDALELLEKFLAEVAEYYKGKGEELKVSESEGLISSKLLMRVGAEGIVTIELVKNVIDELEMPFRFVGAAKDTASPAADDAAQKDSGKSSGSSSDAEPWRVAMRLGSKLFRDSNDMFLGGLLSGVAKYNGWSVSTTRFVVLALFLLGLGANGLSLLLILIYAVVWMCVPLSRNVIDVTRMRKIRQCGNSVDDIELGWKANYDIAISEITYPKRHGCLSVIVKVLFFVPVLLVAILLLFLFGVLLLALFVIFFISASLFGAAMFSNVYVLVLLLLPLLALVHWVLKKFGVFPPLNRFVKLAIVVCWLVTLVLGIIKVNDVIEKNGGWEKIEQRIVNEKNLDKKLLKRIIKESFYGMRMTRYSTWECEPGALPFVIDFNHIVHSDEINIRFFDRDLWYSGNNEGADNECDVTAMHIELQGKKEGTVRFVWDSIANEVLVSHDSSLGISMNIYSVSDGVQIRYMRPDEPVQYGNAMENGKVPFEIRVFDDSFAQMYVMGNDTVDGLHIPPIKARVVVKNDPYLRVSTNVMSHPMMNNKIIDYE